MNVSKFSFSVLLLSLFIISCNEGVVNTTEDLTLSEGEAMDEALREMCGGTCFTLVFPIDFVLPDGSTVTYDDRESMKAGLQEWREVNQGEFESRPEPAYPITVVLDDETEIEITSTEEWKALLKECKPGRRGKMRKGRPDGSEGRDSLASPCFTIVYPITFAFPDGTETEYNSRAEITAGLKAWKESASEEVEGRPELVFPITLTLEDGSEQEVGSQEDWKAVKQDCQPTRRHR